MSLAQWQKDFLNCIQGQPTDFSEKIKALKTLSVEKCIEIYRQGYVARLTESLGESFEATWWVLGDEDFFKTAREYIQQNSSQSFDLAAYGETFADYIEKYQTEIPFIFDLARFEWVFKSMFHAPEQKHQTDLIEVLSGNPEAQLRLSFPAKLWSAPNSVYSIWKQRGGEISGLRDLDWQKPEFLLLQKTSSGIQVSSLTETEFELLQQFEKPTTLTDALNRCRELTPEEIQVLFVKIGNYQVLETA